MVFFFAPQAWWTCFLLPHIHIWSQKAKAVAPPVELNSQSTYKIQCFDKVFTSLRGYNIYVTILLYIFNTCVLILINGTFPQFQNNTWPVTGCSLWIV